MQNTHPLALSLKSTQNVTYFIITHQCQPLSTVRGTFYILCFRNQIYSHLHVTGFFTATGAILLIVAYGIHQNKISSASRTNSVWQALRPRSDPSHSYNDFIYDTASFCNDRPTLGFSRQVQFQNISSLFLVYIYCYLDVCYSISSLISSLHLWSIIFWCVTDHSEVTDFYLPFY